MYLIDTNIISEVRKGQRCNPGVLSWWDGVEDKDLFTSVLVLGEIRRGIEQVRVRDPQKARSLERWLDTIDSQFADRVLGIDRHVAAHWGRMNAVRPIPVIDGLLAATARAYGLTLVTRNAHDVADLGTETVNPFS